MRLSGLYWLLWALGAQAGVVSPELERAMARRGSHADTAVIVRFAEPVDLAPLSVNRRQDRDNRLLLALKERSATHLRDIEPLLATLGAQHIKDLWMINAVAVTLPANAVKPLAAHGAVARVELDSFVQGSRSQRTPLSRTASEFDRALAAPDASSPDGTNALTADPAIEPQWNMAAVQANALWALGYRGAGVVVATMDTGVDLAHPQLRSSWRGGANSWFDPHGEQPTPYDALGHGTQALGVIVGAAGTGVAPDARWIAVRLFNGAGRASMSDIHRAFQWLLDPDGDPATLDAPDVVNASWALNGRSGGSCIMEFSQDIQTLQSAGIAVVFAAGNDGPMPGTSNSPGNNPGVLSVGAVDSDWQLARQTSRGPSTCDGGVFPRLLAPGVNIRSTDLSHGGQASFTTVSGSSLAAPHASGVLALLAGAFPGASVAELEAALLGRSQPARLDALAAVNALRGSHVSAVSGNAPILLAR
jgi:subtilisin family serine protease